MAEKPNGFLLRAGVHAVVEAVSQKCPGAAGASALALALAIVARTYKRSDAQVLALVREALDCAAEAA